MGRLSFYCPGDLNPSGRTTSDVSAFKRVFTLVVKGTLNENMLCGRIRSRFFDLGEPVSLQGGIVIIVHVVQRKNRTGGQIP